MTGSGRARGTSKKKRGRERRREVGGKEYLKKGKIIIFRGVRS